MTPVDWYYAANGQQSGPLESETFRQMVDAPANFRADRILTRGLTHWTSVEEITASSTVLLGTDALEPMHLTLSATGPTLLSYRSVETATTALSEIAMDTFRQTRPWVRFIAIMAFIGAACMLLAGIVIFLGGGITTSKPLSAMTAAEGIFYVVLGALCVIPSELLNRYAGGISRLVETQRMRDLELALGAQKAFWRFVGILAIVIMCFYAVGIAAVIAFQAGILR